MKKSISFILAFVMVFTTMCITPAFLSSAKAATIPKAEWCGSDGNGLYLNITPVSSTSTYRIFIKYAAWNSGDSKPYSNWIKVKDVTGIRKLTKVYVRFPSEIQNKIKLNIRYTVRGMNVSKTKYTTSFNSNNRNLTRWNKYYEAKSISHTKIKDYVLLMNEGARVDNPPARWVLLAKKSNGSWVRLKTFSSNGHSNGVNILITRDQIKKYKINDRSTFTIRLETMIDVNRWVWSGGFKNYYFKLS